VSLRLQLLAFGLLTLVLPWTGFRYVEEMESALRSGLEQSLLASAATVAAALEEQSVELCAVPPCRSHSELGQPVYAAQLARQPRLDGAREDWNVPDDAGLPLGDGHRLWVGVHERAVYLFVQAMDRDLVYRGLPGQTPYGDRIVIGVEPSPGVVRWLLLSTAAPGEFRAQETAPPLFAPTETYDARVIGNWQENVGGFGLEVRLPLNFVGTSLGVGFVDVDHGGGDYGVTLSATWDEATATLGRFIYRRPPLQALLGQFGRAGGRFRILDSQGFTLAETGSVQPQVTGSTAGPIGRLLGWMLRRDDPPYPSEQPFGRVADAASRAALAGRPAAAWYGSGPDREAIVAAAVPIDGTAGQKGAVLLEQASDPILTLTNQALVRLMTLTLLTTMIVGLGLLGYATWLQVRLTRLAHAASTALGQRGDIRTRMPGVGARDEIGTLARSFARLLERLREHTEYLRTLASKLSHELRTPLAVVTTSLDNLEHEAATPAADTYLKRLRQGATRLDSILAAMSEATQLEQAIGNTAAEPLDLAAVVESCCTAYRDVYREREIAYRCSAESARIVGSGELIAQLLDKLIDNAVGFSAPGSRIDIELGESGRELVLSVANVGPRLPAAMRGRLFDSLVSIRGSADGRPHLGLGLYVAALVAEFHGGRCEADDLPAGNGVVFRVVFPRSTAQK
jgi:two-component system, OmpR family, sensor histidine kinase ChvG